MKLEILSNIINDLWHENDVDEIRVRFRYDVESYDVVIVCRDLAISSEDELERVINDALLTGITGLTKTKCGNAYVSKIKEVCISPSCIFEYRIDVVATLGT